MKFPHGLRFTRNGKYVLVADASAPFVHVYASGVDGWVGHYDPAESIRIMDDYLFSRGHTDPKVGGPKGIDLTTDDTILVASCEEQPVVFVGLGRVLQNLDERFPKLHRQGQDADHVERLRSSLLVQLQSLNGKYADALIELEQSRKFISSLQKVLRLHCTKAKGKLIRACSMENMKASIDQVLPDWAKASLRRQYRQTTLRRRQVFADIYRTGIWRQSGRSGAKSPGTAMNDSYVRTVAEFLESLGKPYVVDLGCGDFAIGSQLRPYCARLIACDIVPELIADNCRSFADVDFKVLDIVHDELPKADVAIVRHVLQHLSNSDIANVVARLHYPFLVVTEHLPDGYFEPNKDQMTGLKIRLGAKSGVVLTDPPFGLKPTYQRILCEANEGGSIIRTILYKVENTHQRHLRFLCRKVHGNSKAMTAY
jgi:hypothetical protein